MPRVCGNKSRRPWTFETGKAYRPYPPTPPPLPPTRAEIAAYALGPAKNTRSKVAAGKIRLVEGRDIGGRMLVVALGGTQLDWSWC